jgi:indolepyruvate ferredoxin oxidoreductase
MDASGWVTGLPLPRLPALDRPYGIVIAGIGGSGIVTLGALIGMAAHVEGKGCTVLDCTGLSQKNGAVLSHVRLAREGADIHAARVAPGGAALLLGCDPVVAASREALICVEPGVTQAIVNTHVAPTAGFVTGTDIELGVEAMQHTVSAATGRAATDFVDATSLTTALLGDAIATTLFMLGYAFQKGLLPLSLAAIERAIELNGIAAVDNRCALALGRLAAHDRVRARALVGPSLPVTPSQPQQLADLVAHRAAFLADYQDARYAQRYRDAVAAVAAAEAARTPGRRELALAVARNLFKLMAYKDEYEVARLYTDGRFLDELRRQFEGELRLEFHLAPPIFARRDPLTGVPQKRAYGPWVFTLFKRLARLRRLRGTPFDIFGRTAERRLERALIAQYEMNLREIAAALDHDNHALAVEIASLPDAIRGFGHIKARSVEKVKAREAQLLALMRNAREPAAAA